MFLSSPHPFPTLHKHTHIHSLSLSYNFHIFIFFDATAVKLLPINRDGGYFLNDYDECTDSKRRSEDHKWKRLRGFIRAQALELYAVAAMSDNLPASRRLVSGASSHRPHFLFRVDVLFLPIQEVAHISVSRK